MLRKFWIMMLAVLVLLAMGQFPAAAESRENRDIPETKVVEVEPEDEDEEVVQPEIKIVPDTEDTEELREELKTAFRLLIRYIYSDGRTAAPSHDEILQAGDPFSVTSPTIPGYSTATPLVSGVMPKRDLIYTVIYFAPEDEGDAFRYSDMISLYPIDDYETPLGLGFTMGNVGICFE